RPGLAPGAPNPPPTSDPSPSRGFDGRNGCAHHAILLSLGSLVAEADLLEEAARGAVEELGPDLFALQVVRIALHDAAARLRDQLEGTTNRHGCAASPPILPVDEQRTERLCVGR